MSAEPKIRKSIIDLFWDAMDSMKFAVVLLVTITFISLVGVLLPQFPPNGFAGSMQEFYIDKYGSLIGTVFTAAGLDHVFSVWWYYLLLLLLCLNITICSFHRLGKIIAAVRNESYLDAEDNFKQQSNNRSFGSRLPAGEVAAKIGEILDRGGYRVYSSQAGASDKFPVLYAKRGAISQFGPFISHIAMVLVILGAAVSYMLSFEHFQWMAPGEVIEIPNLAYMSSPSFQMRTITSRLAGVFGAQPEPDRMSITDQIVREHDWRNLPKDLLVGKHMRVRLEKFEALFTPQGKPKAYLSTVSVLDPEGSDQPLFSHLIKVNDPLIHEGIYFYQSSYSPGGGGAQWVDLTVTANDSANQASHDLRMKPGGEKVPLDDSGDSLFVERFVGSFRLGNDGKVASNPGDESNPAVQLVVVRAGQELMRTWVFKNFPNFSHGAGSPYSVVMKDYEKMYLTGLTIRTHRSQSLIWLGFTMMIMGVLLAFYVNHRQFWVMIRPADNGSRAWVAGTSYKWKQPFQAELKKICEKINAVCRQ